MRSKSAAVLDIRSTDITAVVCDRGVNNTFIVKNKYTCPYDGYAEGELLDVKNFVAAVSDAVSNVMQAVSGVKTFYVGVPGEFLKLISVDKVISFSSSKKINSSDCRALVELSLPAETEKWRNIKHSCLYYVLSDKRRIIDPIGCVSDSLQGRFCFFQCDNSFVGCLMDAFKNFKSIITVNLIPTPLAEAMYLIEPEKRDEYAVLFDLGFISSTYSVICGNGILYSQSFSLGTGHIAVYLMEALDVPYDVAMHYLTTVNLNARESLTGKAECMYEGKLYEFACAEIRAKIRECLDGICETIEECKNDFSGRNIEGKPLYITGSGALMIRGACDHISGRLVTAVETVAPKLPYYDKPKYSSLFSLMNMALGE